MSVGGDAIILTEDPTQFRRKAEFIRQRAIGGILTIKNQTGAYSPISDDAGVHLASYDAVDTSWTLTNDLPAGLWFHVTQMGVGRVTFGAGAGATVNTALAAARTRAQFSQVRVDVISNLTGTSAIYVISGDAG